MTRALTIDCTQVVVTVLAAGMPRTRLCTELPDKFETMIVNNTVDAVIQVFRVGGPNDGYVIDKPTIVLHAYAKTQADCSQQLHTAYTVLQDARGAIALPGGVRAVLLHDLRLLSGPAYAPYVNTDVRHGVSIVQPQIKIAA